MKKHWLIGVIGLFCSYNTPSQAQVDNMGNTSIEIRTEDDDPIDAELKNGEETTYTSNGKLKSVERFKNGTYSGIQRYYDESGQLREEYEYSKGIKEGFTRQLHPNGVIAYRGLYKNNQKYGKFSWHDDKGQLKYQGHYENGQEIVDDTEVMPNQQDKPQYQNPSYLGGGTKGLWVHLSRNIKYPEEARRKKIEGKVVLGFMVNRDGEIEDVHIRKSVNKVLDEEALRVITNLPYAWSPGTINEERIRSFQILPIIFHNKKNK